MRYFRNGCLRQFWSKLCRALNLRHGLDDDLADEMRSHLDFLLEEKLSQGLPPHEALTAARRSFGNQAATLERAREAWQFPRFETFLKDLRYGFRSVRNSPAVSLVLILTLGLGIGANAAIFSVVYSVLLRPLPYPSGERLVRLGESTQKADGISVTWLNLQHWIDDNHSFESIAGYTWTDLTMTGRGEAALLHAAMVTSAFFRLTGFQPRLGRLFAPEDDKPGAVRTIILSGEFWAGTLGGDPEVLGQTLVLNGRPYQIIGVLPPGLKFLTRPIDLYLPLGLSASTAAARSQHGSIRALALLRPGVTLAAARADLDAIMEHLAQVDPGPEDDHRVSAVYLAEVTIQDVRQPLFLMMSAVVLVLLLACSNVASLLLVRTTSRSREIAIRAAIGAGRARIARQLLTESLVIATFGGGLGLLLASLCLRGLVLIGPTNIPRLSEAAIDGPVLIFTTVVTLMVALAAGAGPVFTSGRLDLTAALKDGSAGAGAGRRGGLSRGALVIAEIAITLVLSFASGLLIRSLIEAQTRYPGFDPDHLLALELQLPPSAYKTNESVRQFYGRLIDELRRQPGVESAAAVTCPPSAGDCGDYWYSILGKPAPARGDVPLCLFNRADAAYFDAMHIRMLAGRGFNEEDREKGPLSAVINEELARQWWPTPDLALGQQIKMGGPYMDGPVYNIVGVVGNVSQMGLDADPRPEVFFAFSQQASSAMVVMIRTVGASTPLIPAVRAEVASLDRNVPIQSLRPFEKWLGAPLERRRFMTLLLTSFAALAMILAAVGIYGVLSYWVSARQREIAIRVALGARRPAILRWAGSHAMLLAVIGIALGGFGCWGASRWLRTLVFGVSVADPRMMFAATVSVIAVSAMAVSIPLWRALQVDPVRNLHEG
jgi:putative ABC transport system permease protein